MTLINCLPGVKVKIISKSIGMSFERLHYRETEIQGSCIENDKAIADIQGNYFFPHDLEPLWKEGK